MKESIYYIKPDEKRKDIERYSDKYQEKQQATKQGCIGKCFKRDLKSFPITAIIVHESK